MAPRCGGGEGAGAQAGQRELARAHWHAGGGERGAKATSRRCGLRIRCEDGGDEEHHEGFKPGCRCGRGGRS